jgi:DNA-binding NtrC family response regulator
MEDDPDVGETTREILAGSDLHVVLAPNVERALRLCDAVRFDVVVLDHHASGSEGAAFLERTPLSLLVVIVSAAEVESLSATWQRYRDSDRRPQPAFLPSCVRAGVRIRRGPRSTK